jgi:hypothetical protein
MAFEGPEFWVDNGEDGPLDYWVSQEYLRNPNNSISSSSAYTIQSIGPYTDFDISVKMVKFTSNGSKADIYTYWFTDSTYIFPKNGPVVITEIHAYGTGDAYDYAAFIVKDKNGGNSLFNSGELRKYDFSRQLGDWFIVRVQKQGNNFYYKIWKEDEGEPVDWDISTSIEPSAYTDEDDIFEGSISISSNGLSGYDDFTYSGSDNSFIDVSPIVDTQSLEIEQFNSTISTEFNISINLNILQQQITINTMLLEIANRLVFPITGGLDKQDGTSFKKGLDRVYNPNTIKSGLTKSYNINSIIKGIEIVKR